MKESTLLKVALIIFIFGTITLYLFAGKIDVQESTIDKITSEYIDKQIKIKGYVASCNDMEKVAYIKIAQPQLIDIVVFKNSALEIKENDYIEVTGNVDEYNGKLQIIANEINLRE